MIRFHGGVGVLRADDTYIDHTVEECKRGIFAIPLLVCRRPSSRQPGSFYRLGYNTYIDHGVDKGKP